MRELNIKTFNAESGATSLTGTAIQSGKLGGATLFSVQAQATDDASGTVTVQYSNDVSDGTNTFTPTNWTTISASSASLNSSTDYAYQSSLFCAEWLRVVYTRSSGTGTVTARIKAVGVTH